jgi:hypothetical protein
MTAVLPGHAQVLDNPDMAGPEGPGDATADASDEP